MVIQKRVPPTSCLKCGSFNITVAKLFFIHGIINISRPRAERTKNYLKLGPDLATHLNVCITLGATAVKFTTAAIRSNMLEDFAGYISVTHWKALTHKENYYDIYFFIQSSYTRVLCQEKKNYKWKPNQPLFRKSVGKLSKPQSAVRQSKTLLPFCFLPNKQ